MKSQAKHTAGPWQVGANGESAREHAICSGALVIGIAYGFGYPARKHDKGGWAPESAANARLMAAAPRMLEALLYIVDWKPEGWSAERARDLARAAIEEATGADSAKRAR